MILNLELSRKAGDDLEAIDEYLSYKGQAFRHALRETLAGLCEAPGKGRPLVSVNPNVRQRLESVRFYTVNRFRSYVIYYRVQGRVLLALRLLHGAQDRDSEL